MPATIYALHHPETGEVRYIGKANDPAKRLAGHLRDMHARRTPVYDWMRTLGQAPVMSVVEVVPDGGWQEAERRHIAEHRQRGARLLNLAQGGDEPYCSPEQRRTNGARMQHHPNTAAARLRNGPANAKKRDALLWAARKRLGMLKQQARTPGVADRVAMAIQLFEAVPVETRRLMAERVMKEPA